MVFCWGRGLDRSASGLRGRCKSPPRCAAGGACIGGRSEQLRAISNSRVYFVPWAAGATVCFGEALEDESVLENPNSSQLRERQEQQEEVSGCKFTAPIRSQRHLVDYCDCCRGGRRFDCRVKEISQLSWIDDDHECS